MPVFKTGTVGTAIGLSESGIVAFLYVATYRQSYRRALRRKRDSKAFSGGYRRSRDASPLCRRVGRAGGVRAGGASLSRCAAASSPNNKARTLARNRPAESRLRTHASRFWSGISPTRLRVYGLEAGPTCTRVQRLAGRRGLARVSVSWRGDACCSLLRRRPTWLRRRSSRRSWPSLAKTRPASCSALCRTVHARHIRPVSRYVPAVLTIWGCGRSRPPRVRRRGRPEQCRLRASRPMPANRCRTRAAGLCARHPVQMRVVALAHALDTFHD